MLTPQELIAFEQRIADAFNRKEIPYPVHLSSGNEEALIEIFEDIKPEDWIFCSWRSHPHALLKGVPETEVEAAIRAGRSMTLCFPEHRVFSSAIVGGILPIATGLAMGIKRRTPKRSACEWVHVFCGDMTATTGAFHECTKYAAGHALPIRFIVEDNGVSVTANTKEVWGDKMTPGAVVQRYSTVLTWPHSGAGQRISF
jgi:pyruvate dehydrogenase E1 component alpha subunit